MRREEKDYRDTRLWVALTLSLLFGALPATAQTTGIQPIWLVSEDTSQLADLLFGPGVAEVPTLSSGATTAGGTVSWVRHFEKDDHLGMHHVYYHQLYHHPQLGRSLKVLGTGVSLHYAADGSLSHADLAQVTDVPPLPVVALTTPQQAFAAAQLGLAAWPGFNAGDPTLWPPGTLASILDRSELTLDAPRGVGAWRIFWRLSFPDASWESYTVLLDGSTGEMLAVSPLNPHDDCPPVGCAHCSPGHDGMPEPVYTDALAVPENPAVPVRNAAASPLSNPDEQELDCGRSACTYEAVRERQPGAQCDPDIPQIEVYHGMDKLPACRHCGFSDGPYEGAYMRVGLKQIGGTPTYDVYSAAKGKIACQTDPEYRRFAGDAILFTRRTMEVFSSFGRWGFDGACGVARVVVDAAGGEGAQFWANLPIPDTYPAPLKSVRLGRPTAEYLSPSAALDVVAHEWGHGVDDASPGNFLERCKASGVDDVCELSEGFADVVGHIVERFKQPVDSDLEDDDYEVEHWEWTAQEDWVPSNWWWSLRRADRYSTNGCPGFHHSVHAEDPGCGVPGSYNPNGNRLGVVRKLMTDGGLNPGAEHVVPCTGCDIDVTPLDPDADTSFEMAARVLFRILDTEAYYGTVDWDDLPYHARNAARVLYPDRCEEAQSTVIDAFRAVGYPQQLAVPCPFCPPYRDCPPCCPPDYCCGVVEE